MHKPVLVAEKAIEQAQRAIVSRECRNNLNPLFRDRDFRYQSVIGRYFYHWKNSFEEYPLEGE